ncbi:MAG: transglutaminase domain-containing protein [Flavobacteriaceae bacterium]
MKKILAILLLLTTVVNAQTPEKKVWDLLLANKRDDARKLFDKELKSKVASNINYFILDNFISLERGKNDFDDSFVKTLSTYPDAKNYLTPLFKQPFLLDDVNQVGYNDFTYQKIDAMATAEAFKDNPSVIYNKAVCDRNRKNYEGYSNYIAKLNSIMNWQLCGAFENLNGSGLDTEYEAEIYPKNDKLFNANSNGMVGWYNPRIIQNEGYITFSNENEYGNAIMYSQIFLENPVEQQLYFNVGSSDGIKVFVNDIEVFSNSLIEYTDLDAFKFSVKMPKGINRILVKSSINSGNCYFFTSLTDANGKKVDGLVYHNTYKPYNKSTLQDLDVNTFNAYYEDYFDKKSKENPNDVVYKILLFDGYMHNRKLEKAFDVIEELDAKYPNSSMIKTRLADYYAKKGDNAKVNEINKNIEINDPDYFYTLATKAQDSDWLRETNIVEIEKYKERAKKLESPTIGLLYEFLINARNSKIKEMLVNVDQLIEQSHNSEFYITTMAPLYDNLEKNKDKTLKMLEDLYAKKDNFSALSKLVQYYRDANRKDDVKKIFEDRLRLYPYFTGVAGDVIENLIEEKKYPEALKAIDDALGLFPYSFVLLEKKGMVYNYMNNTKEAEKYIREALIHNSENNALRKQLYDITKNPDEIEEVAHKDLYKFIKEKRNSKLKSDYGVVVLLDEYIVNILPEGGRKSKVTYVYEITAENGIEELKEYNLGSYTNLLKSEIVKADGSIAPAEEGSGTLVFSDLKVGDVIFIQYEDYDNNTGRFFKDFNLGCYFNSTYPEAEVLFTLIHPNDVTYNSSLINGDITPVTKKINNKTCTTWKKLNSPAIPLIEDYAPAYGDMTNSIKVSTIKSWKEIANWYSDLVKKNLLIDKITKNTFDQIFPNGYQSLSQTEIAKKIYSYIEDNITYSSLDFRQSGYVPQKPSKTITTKLGDCKDVSTLFVALSQQAGLKSNLVLVSTNDNGYKNMRLPAIDFNHCIVKTTIDGKEFFLELTDKYLPFQALPISLYNANALVISFDKNENENVSLIQIPFKNATVDKLITKSTLTIDDNSKTMVSQHQIFGALKSYYNQLFSNATTDDVRKKELEDLFSKRLKKNMTLQSDKLVENKTYDDFITFETNFTIPEKTQSVGSLKITDMPFLEKVYTRDIIAQETRKMDINYIRYENCKEYQSTLEIKIPEGKKFIEIPENKKFAFKQHNYELVFEHTLPNVLKIKRTVSIPWDNISTTEYAEYKKYVDEVITAEEQIVGFK